MAPFPSGERRPAEPMSNGKDSLAGICPSCRRAPKHHLGILKKSLSPREGFVRAVNKSSDNAGPRAQPALGGTDRPQQNEKTATTPPALATGTVTSRPWIEKLRKHLRERGKRDSLLEPYDLETSGSASGLPEPMP